MKKLFKISLFVIILLIGIIVLAVYWTFYRPLPNRDAALSIPDMHQQARIYWGPHGVPHIYAKNKHDLYFSLGYVHAQDRLWQMTLSQLAARGQFAEYFGKSLVPLDKLQRTIGFWEIAKEMWKQLPNSTEKILQAYSNGVNWYINHHKKELPIQFSLTGMKPIPWNVTYSLAEARLMAWELNTAWQTELTYAMLHKKLSPAQYNALFPNPHIPHDTLQITRKDSSQITSEDSTLSATFLPLLKNYDRYKQMMGVAGRNAGSNAWAVDGEHSTTGKPLLAGDPHLNLYIPGKWYEVQLNLNGENVSGATIPGNPAVVLGQNDALAWSFTSMMLDDTDFFVEKLDPGDSTRYLTDTSKDNPTYKKLKYKRSLIKVKNEDDIVFTRKTTKDGPVISDIYPNQHITKGRLISMKWVGQKPGKEVQAMLGMDWAQNFGTFKKAVKKLKTPALNIIYADTSGNIALLPGAAIPIRTGNPLILRPGWKPDMEWHGYIPYSKLPKIINPSKGWVANANNRVKKEPYYMSVYWATDSRYNRIGQYLTKNKTLSPKNFKALQVDTYSAYTEKMTNLILPLLKASNDSSFNKAIGYLKNWDYIYDTSEIAASIFDEFLINLSKNVFQDEMGAELYDRFIDFAPKPERALLRLMQDSRLFFDNVHTTPKKSKKDIINKSMRQTLSFLKKKFGKNPAKWRWGKLHSLTLRPPLLGQAAQSPHASGILESIVDHIFNKGPYPVSGSSTTINNASYTWHHPFNMIHGPSIRRIIDLGNMHSSLSILPTGQSGNPLSKFYGDQTQLWLLGRYKHLYQDSSLFSDYTIMTLKPKE